MAHQTSVDQETMARSVPFPRPKAATSWHHRRQPRYPLGAGGVSPHLPPSERPRPRSFLQAQPIPPPMKPGQPRAVDALGATLSQRTPTQEPQPRPKAASATNFAPNTKSGSRMRVRRTWCAATLKGGRAPPARRWQAWHSLLSDRPTPAGAGACPKPLNRRSDRP